LMDDDPLLHFVVNHPRFHRISHDFEHRPTSCEIRIVDLDGHEIVLRGNLQTAALKAQAALLAPAPPVERPSLFRRIVRGTRKHLP
jgi:hypothetical protein